MDVELTEEAYRRALQVEGQIEALIEKRHDERLKETDQERREEELWKESVRRYTSRQQAQLRQEWAASTTSGKSSA